MAFVNIPGHNLKASAPTVGDLPIAGNSTGDIRVVLDESAIYIWSGSAWVLAQASVDWGDIGGSIGDQADLQAELALKAPLASPTFTGTVTAGSILQVNTSAQITVGDHLTVVNDNDPTSTSIGTFVRHSSSIAGASAQARFLRTRGTTASPSAVLSGDSLVSLSFGGYNSAAYVNSANVVCQATENWDGTKRGTSVTFNAAPTGLNVATTRMVFSGDGNITVTPHLLWSADGASDIGASGANRPNNAYVATAVIVPSVTNATGVAVQGSNTNDSAASGFVGEFLQERVTVFTDVPGATGDWADADSISLTAGDWDVTGILSMQLNGGTITQMDLGISTTSGNSATGLQEGDNFVESAALPAGAVHQSVSIPSFRMSLSGTTTVYLKVKAAYAVAAPQYVSRISARRVR